MNAAEPASDDKHPHLRHLKERLAEHHRQARARREESSLEEAIEGATFDLGSDIGHPTAGHEAVGYDVETDLGVDGSERPADDH